MTEKVSICMENFVGFVVNWKVIDSDSDYCGAEFKSNVMETIGHYW